MSPRRVNMVLTIHSFAEQKIRNFLNQSNIDIVKIIKEDFSGGLFFLKLDKGVAYNSSKDQYVLKVKQKRKIRRKVKGSNPKTLYARNGFIYDEGDWEVGRDIAWNGVTMGVELTHYFNTTSEVEEFYREKVEYWQERLDGIAGKYMQADDIKEEEIVITGEGTIKGNSEPLETKGKEEEDKPEDTISKDPTFFDSVLPWRQSGGVIN